MTQKQILIVGGTAGIGLALAKKSLKSGYKVSVVGRNLKAIDHLKTQYPQNLIGYKVDLSELDSLEAFMAQVSDIRLDTLVFTSGMLSGKTWETKEGNEVNYITNHFSRQFITQKLLPSLLKAERPTIAYISSIGHYKKLLDADIPINKVSEKGLKTSMQSYVPNDLFFYELSKQQPRLCIVGFNPGPTKGTSLNRRTHSPAFFKWINPIFKLVAKPVEQISSLFFNKIEKAQSGLQFWSKAKKIDIPDFFKKEKAYERYANINAQIISSVLKMTLFFVLLFTGLPNTFAQKVTSIGLELDPFFIATNDFVGELHIQSDRLRTAIGYWNGIYPDYMSGDQNFEININTALATRFGYFLNEKKTFFTDIILMGMDWTVTHNETQQVYDLSKTQFTYGLAAGYRWQPFEQSEWLAGLHLSPTLFFMYGVNPDNITINGQTFTPRSFMFLVTPRIGYQYQF